MTDAPLTFEEEWAPKETTVTIERTYGDPLLRYRITVRIKGHLFGHTDYAMTVRSAKRRARRAIARVDRKSAAYRDRLVILEADL